jgi:hypothetical protein
MPAARMAAVSLMAWMMLCSQAGAPQQSDARTHRIEGAKALRADSSTELLPLANMRSASSLTALEPWRHRIKSVLEETDPNVQGQIELGPVALPERRARSSSIELFDHRPPCAVPLRC